MHETNIRNLDLNLLVALEVLLAEVSVTRAAQHINLSQPAMSRALDRLRHVLKDPLLVRSGRGMVLTPRAEALRKPMQDAMERVRGVLAPNEFNPATSQAHFRIVGHDHLVQRLMPKALEEVYRQAPNVSVEIVGMSSEGIQQLADGDIDLGFGVVNDGPDLGGTYHQPLLEDHFVCLMREGHPLETRGLDVESFAAASHALISVTGKGKGAMDRRLEKIGLSRKVALRLPHFLAARAVIETTDLLLAIPQSLADTISMRGVRVVELPAEISGGSYMISQIWHERFHQDPARKWLRSIIKRVSEGINRT